jgi:hypothetical protein
MRKFKSRWSVDDTLFVIVVVAAAVASAVLEAGALVGDWPTLEVPVASSLQPAPVRPAAAGSSVDGALVSAATPRSAR